MFNVSGFIAYMVITTYTPGPNNLMCMSIGSRYGFKKSLAFSLGVPVGFTILLTLSALFGNTLYTAIPTIKPVMLILGATYMLWLAWKIFRSSYNTDVKDSKYTGFISAIFLQFLNVKGIVYSLTVMSGYILPYYSDFKTISLLIFVMVVVCASSTICWALFGTVFYKFFSKYTKIVNAILALSLVYCAAALFF